MQDFRKMYYLLGFFSAPLRYGEKNLTKQSKFDKKTSFHFVFYNRPKKGGDFRGRFIKNTDKSTRVLFRYAQRIAGKKFPLNADNFGSLNVHNSKFFFKLKLRFIFDKLV